MKYCQETAIVQSSFLLAGEVVNLEENIKKHEFAKVSGIIQDAINEVSKGLSIDGKENPVTPIETSALHRKLHLWIYKTWRCYSCNSTDQDGYLEGFPPLPRFGTHFYIKIVSVMSWESLLVECLVNTQEKVLPLVLQDIISVMADDQPCTKEDSDFFTLLFDCVLALSDNQVSYCTLFQLLLNGLSSMPEIIHDDLQVHLMKKSIDFIFHTCFMAIHLNMCKNASQIRGIGKTNLEKVLMPDTVCHYNNGSLYEDKEVSQYRPLLGKVLYPLEVLMKLFTEQWKNTCHWSNNFEDGIGQMNCDLWHPLHQWILKLYAVLGFVNGQIEMSQDSRMCSFHDGLKGYIETFATNLEKEWIGNLEKGLLVDWNACGFNILEQDEQIDISVCSSETFMFTHASLKEQLHDAVWRVSHNLEGALDSLNWLLTTEELFDSPIWLKCVRENAVKIGCKEQAIMMIDILCVQRHRIESVPVSGCDCNLFYAMKGLIIDIFSDLPVMDQEEILKYAFSVSLLSTVEVTCDSVFFNPSQLEEDKKKLQDELQVVFNKLVDSSLVSSFRRQVGDVKKLAMLSPYITLYKALQTAVQYGQTHTIVKMLQQWPFLCKLCTSDVATPVLCEILASIAGGLQNEHEEKNLIKLVKKLLQGYRNVDLPGMSQPLLDASNLVTTCVLPYVNLHGNKNLIPRKLVLKLLKCAVTTFDVKDQAAKTFVLRYLVPLVLALCRLLNGSKVHWEDMGCDLPLADAPELRNLILVNLEVTIPVIQNVFQSKLTGLIHPVEWLNNKLKSLDWTVSLHIKPLLDILPLKHQCHIPQCVIEFCDLPNEHWSACDNECSYDVVDGLFGCCAISDEISSQIIDAIKEKTLFSVDVILEDHIIRNLSQGMTYFTWSEMSRILSLCKTLIQKGLLSLQSLLHHSKVPRLSSVDLPTKLNGILVLSCILRQVFQLLSNLQGSFSKVILVNVIKLYVSAIKEICQELVTDPGLDKSLSGDVTTAVFDDLCHVICMVPLEVTDPLFILALDIASMVSGRHALTLKQSVAAVPKSVYTESLLKKLDTVDTTQK